MKQKMMLTLSLLLLFGNGIAYSTISKTPFQEVRITNNEKINLIVKDVSIKQIFTQIEQQIDFKFIYMSDQIFLQKRISVTIKNQDLNQALSILKTKINLDFKITTNGVLVKELNPIVQKTT